MHINNNTQLDFLLGFDNNEEDPSSIPEPGDSYNNIPITFHGMSICYNQRDLPMTERGQYEGYTAEAVKTYNLLSDYCLKPSLSMGEAHHMVKLLQHYNSTMSAARNNTDPQADAAYARMEAKIRNVSGFLHKTLDYPQDSKVMQKTHYQAHVSHTNKATAAYKELTARWKEPISSQRDIEYLEQLIKTYDSEISLAIDSEKEGIAASKQMRDHVSAISTALVHLKYTGLNEGIKPVSLPSRAPPRPLQSPSPSSNSNGYSFSPASSITHPYYSYPATKQPSTKAPEFPSPSSNRNDDYSFSPASSITTQKNSYSSPTQRPSISTHDISTETENFPSPSIIREIHADSPIERPVLTRGASTQTLPYEPATSNHKQDLHLDYIPPYNVTLGMNQKTKEGINAYNILAQGREKDAKCIYECARTYYRNMSENFQSGPWINERLRQQDSGFTTDFYEYLATKPDTINYWEAHYATCDHMYRIVESAARQVKDVLLQWLYADLLKDLHKYRNQAQQFYVTSVNFRF